MAGWNLSRDLSGELRSGAGRVELWGKLTERGDGENGAAVVFGKLAAILPTAARRRGCVVSAPLFSRGAHPILLPAMPTYDYVCQRCGHQFEVFQSMSAPRLSECPQPECAGPVRRLIGTGAGIVFKGSGFYETDYKRKATKPAGESGGGSGSSSGGSGGGSSSGGSASGGSSSGSSTGSGGGSSSTN